MRFATGRAEEPAKPSQARRSLRNGCSRFDDPYAITQRDATFEDKQRWITVGAIGPVSILLVVHTFYEEHNEEVIRVTSARAAESHERRAYEEAHKGAETRHPSYRRKKRPEH
jgi:uncharacterized DUF497 family protein